jgi:uncharacterized membrane protein YedE/YeeE
MLIKSVKNPRALYSVAMMCLAAGIVAGSVGHASRASDFWDGVLQGVRFGLYGVALVLVVRARRLAARR